MALALVLVAGCKDKVDKPPKAAPKAQAESRPAIKLVTLSPAVMTKNSMATAGVEAQDPDGKPLTESYRWEINGKTVPTNGGPELALTSVKDGDSVQVFAIVSNGRSKSDEVPSEKKIVTTSKPVVLEIRIEPMEVYAGTELTARVGAQQSQDSTARAITYRYQWYKNGQPVPGGDSAILSGSNFKRGDKIKVRVWVDDGVNKSEPAETSDVTVLNSNPEIASAPRFDQQGDRFVYRLETKDPDGDAITYKLLSPEPGAYPSLSFDGQQGVLSYTPIIGKTAVVRIRAEDGAGGSCEQEFTIGGQEPAPEP
ncbi:MAG: hypothetical protein HQK57_12435 [Deltaproteobacteria bacterium]|nr:hypothetical protein [Deltaproteobacteria bacterium]